MAKTRLLRGLSFLAAAAVLTSFLAAAPAGAQQDALAELRTSEKLRAPADILADFDNGAPETAVIVLLRPTPAAGELAARSRASARMPAEFSRPGAAVYYDLQDESVRTQLLATVTETVARVIGRLGPAGVTVTQRFSYQFGFAARVTPEALAKIVASPDVIAVEKDVVLEAQLAQGIPLMNASGTRATHTGAGLSIAICDTGIDTSHPALGGGATFPNTKVIGGYDVGDGDADPRPGSAGEAHGTACAGIAAGATGTVGDYIGGVAPDAKLYAVKISTGTGGTASSSAMIAGWEWCVTHKNDDPANPILIISTSFGGGRYYSACDAASAGMTTAAANAVAAGITIFASSGNDGYCDSMGWPACISHVNSVGAVYDANFGTYTPCVSSASCAAKTSTTGCATGFYATDATLPDKVTSYSNSASFLTLMAPSNQAATTDIVGTGGYSTGDYAASFGGTSAACPYAAGAAAALQSAAKTLTGSFLTPAAVRSGLVNTGDTVTDGKVAIAKPRVNLGRAIEGLTTTLPTVAISATDPTATEAGPTPGQFTVSRTGGTTAALTVNFTASGTATPGSDYSSIGTSVTIPVGAASATIAVNPIDDAAAEGDETVIVTLSAGAAYWLGTPSATVTIIDNEVLTLAQALDTALTVSSGGNANWTAQTLTTHDGADAAQSGTIADGQTSWIETTATGASVSFWWRVSSEGSWDYLRFFIDGILQAQISGEVAWQQQTFPLGAGSHTLKWEYVKDPDCCVSGSDRGWLDQLVIGTTPLVTVAANDEIAGEAGPTTGQFTVSRSGSSAAALTVNFAVSGTATPGIDYTGIGTSVTIPAGAASATVTVTPVPDATVEADETVVLTLAAGSYQIGTPASATVTIQEVASPSLAEALDTGFSLSGGGSAPWRGQTATTHDGVDAAQSGAILHSQSSSVQMTVAGTSVGFWWRVSSEASFDYLRFYIDGVQKAFTSGLGTTWLQHSFALTPGLHTLKWEYTKDSSVNAGSDCGWVDQVVVAQPTVTVTANDPAATEAGPTTGQFTVSRTGATTEALAVAFSVSGTATAGSDYAGIGAGVTIPAGSASATVTVTPIDDAVVEGDETVILTLGAGAAYLVGAPASATVTIASDDVAAPADYVLWTNSATGQAIRWKIDPVSLALAGWDWISPAAGVGAGWEATSYARGDAAADYVLWTNSGTGQAIRWSVDPGTGARTGWIWISPTAGVGKGWQASSYERGDAATDYVLWSNSTTGQATRWSVDPGTGTMTGLHWISPTAGVGAGWQATGYERGEAATDYVLWVNSSTGQALRWQVAPATGERTGWGWISPTGGVGAGWQASSYERGDAATDYVLWTNSGSGQGLRWGVAPATGAITGWGWISPTTGVGGGWRATSYLGSEAGAAPGADPVLASAAGGITVHKGGSGAGTVAAGAERCGPDCDALLVPNDALLAFVTATPEPGSRFAGWETTAGEAIDILAADPNDTVLAVFERE